MRHWDRILALIGGGLAFAALATPWFDLLPYGLALMMSGSVYRFFAIPRSNPDAVSRQTIKSEDR